VARTLLGGDPLTVSSNRSIYHSSHRYSNSQISFPIVQPTLQFVGTDSVLVVVPPTYRSLIRRDEGQLGDDIGEDLNNHHILTDEDHSFVCVYVCMCDDAR